MQSTGHSSMHALSSRSTQGSAITYVTGWSSTRTSRAAPQYVTACRGTRGGGSVGAGWNMTVRYDMERLVGRRVSVRQRVGERDGRPLFDDAVGDLVTDGAGLVVQTRRGPVRVDPGAVVAARAVPPAVPRRAGLAAIVTLESLCADAWPAAV